MHQRLPDGSSRAISIPSPLAPTQAVGFDYSALPPDVAEEARATAHHVRERTRAAIIETGRDLRRIKARLRHGLFLKWIDAEFGMTPRTAQNYMAAAALVEKNEIVSHLPPTSVVQLAAPSTPKSAHKEVVRRLEAGEPLTPPVVRSIIKDAQAEQKRGQEEIAEKRGSRPPGKHQASTPQINLQSRSQDQRQAVFEVTLEDPVDPATESKAAVKALRLLMDRLGPDFPRFVSLFTSSRGQFDDLVAEIGRDE